MHRQSCFKAAFYVKTDTKNVLFLDQIRNPITLLMQIRSILLIFSHFKIKIFLQIVIDYDFFPFLSESFLNFSTPANIWEYANSSRLFLLITDNLNTFALMDGNVRT